jgi:flagellar biosynthesis protein FlhG
MSKSNFWKLFYEILSMKRRLFLKLSFLVSLFSFLKNPQKIQAAKKEVKLSSGFSSSAPGSTVMIVSRKGGVGNTVITGNLGFCLSERGHRVLIVDTGEFGGVCTVFGIESSEWFFDEVRENQVELDKLCSTSSHGVISVLRIPYQDLANPEHRLIISRIFNSFDVRLVDVATATNIQEKIMEGPLVGEIVMVTTPEVASVTATYALLKQIILAYPGKQNKINLIVNQAEEEEGQEIYHTINSVSKQYLGRGFNCLGSIPTCQDLRKSVQHQKPLIQSYPTSESALKFHTFASAIVSKKQAIYQSVE